MLGEARRLADFTLPAGTFKRFELEQVVRLLLDVLSGLSALHEVVTDGEAFVHGEVSPQHVYVDQHGTARIVPLLSSHLTGSSRPEGTGYLAPERIAAEPLDARADVFSVGVMLWEALAGSRLFPDPSLPAVRARLAQPLEPKLAARERWAEPLCAIARRAIALEPALRFRTALELSHAIASAAAPQLSGVDVDAWQEEAPTPVFQPRLHLAELRSKAAPPPLPPSTDTSGPDTAPPTTSEERPSAPLGRPPRRRGRSALVLLAVCAAASAWAVAYRLPQGWQKLGISAPSAGERSSLPRAAASPVATPAAAEPPAPPPVPASSPPEVSAAPSASAPPAIPPPAAERPQVDSAPPVVRAPVRHKPKAKPVRDYGI